MFNGLIREIGEVVDFENEVISIKSSLTPNIGDSIAVNGVCLSVIEYQNKIFKAALSLESRNKIAIENLCNKVHVERALRLSDGIDGHLLQGHVDSIGVIENIIQNENSYEFYISYEKNIKPLLVEKGSIGIDGVSLTINECKENYFRLTIIPHTFENTLFSTYEVKRRVNIETDIITRSVFNVLKNTFESKFSWEKIDSILGMY